MSGHRWGHGSPVHSARARGVVAGLALVLLAAVATQTALRVRQERSELSGFAEAISESLALSVAEPLWSLSEPTLKELLGSLNAFPAVEAVVLFNEGTPWLVYDAETGVYSLGPPTGRRFWTHSTFGFAERPDAFMTVEHTVSYDSQVIGSLRLTVNDNTLTDTIMRALALSVLAYVAITAALLLGLRAWENSVRSEFLNRRNEQLEAEISRRVEVEDQLRRLAYYDPVTSLPRAEALGQEIFVPPVSDREIDPEHAERFLMVVSLENLPELSAILDSVVVSELLRAFGDRIVRALPDGDGLALRAAGFRFFAIVLARDEAHAGEIAADLVAQFRRPVQLRSRTVRMRVRLGVSRFDDEEPFEEVRKRAESALSSARRDSGANRVGFFDESRRNLAAARVRVESAMSSDTFQSELLLHFQPIVDLKTRRPVGYEALVRWRHPELGMVSPMDFIPLAEENGKIFDVGWHVIHTGLEAAASLGPNTFVSVNLSPVQLLEDKLPQRIVDALETHRVSAQKLNLEITETAIDHNEATFLRVAGALHDKGLSVVIDDFGSGSSALRRLHDNHFDMLKIDQHFIRHSDLSERSALVVESVASLAHGMRMDVVAEGIETEEQAEFARAAGCNLGQGYLFGRPVPIENLRTPGSG